MKTLLAALFAGLLALTTAFGVLFLFTGASNGVVVEVSR